MRAPGLAVALVAAALLASSATAKRAVLSPKALQEAFLCIHRYEGSWTDSGAPYYGGLQMDHSFMRTYGAEFLSMWGSADRWPPSVQIAVAMRAYHTRGFSPWPNTARRCGLL